MTGDRFVVLGLARVGSPWFSNVSRWATAAALPIEFVKAMSAEEVRVRLAGGRAYSTLLADDEVIGLDRDLVSLAQRHGCSVILVARGQRALHLVDDEHVLAPDFGREDLLRALTSHAHPIARREDARQTATEQRSTEGFRGRLVTVTGPTGAGRSTLAMGLAQELAADARHAEQVCLADCALVADQGLLHGAPDVVPSVVELSEAHRLGRPTVDDVRAHTWRVVDRRYHVLLGLRQRRDWTSLRQTSFEAALDGLRRAFPLVIVDTDDELDGEQATGSVDIEERNLMARTTVEHADLVVVVGSPGVQGLHHLLRAVRGVLAFGVPPARVLPILNQAPKGRRAQAQASRAFGQLLARSSAASVCAPLPLAPRRGIDAAIRDARRLPDGWAAPVGRTVLRLLESASEPTSGRTGRPRLVAIRAGELGRWSDDSDDGELG